MTREEAIDIFEHNWTRLENHDYTEEELNEALDMAIESLNQLTSYERTINKLTEAISNQAPKIGRWKRIGHDIYECSICGQDVMTGDICAYRHCHCCGTKMESEHTSCQP